MSADQATLGRGGIAAPPRDRAFDSTLALLSEGYAVIPNRCRRYGTDLFATRLMLGQDRHTFQTSGPRALTRETGSPDEAARIEARL